MSVIERGRKFGASTRMASAVWHGGLHLKLEGVDHYAPTGLAYDASKNAILITDSINDTLYRIPVDAADKSELLYWHKGRANPPGFDGLTVTPQGVIYVAALGQRGIARLDGEKLNLYRRSISWAE